MGRIHHDRRLAAHDIPQNLHASLGVKPLQHPHTPIVVTAVAPFSTAHTIALAVPFAEMLGVAPGYAKLLAVRAAGVVDNFA